ncbi:acyltransferase family protein [Arthrobacter sp. NEB 688]|uniref:acyltransferase family protein n=1 Tax=Arthrobacter sp. NEB 688 TaxID=904039 RepID=UPI00156377C3|nr:acyltransferase family protein [Arthrobacter sp. NEB 688]QKE83546.1 acyltransferase [Arthrobacter sp. NEB 688]
MSGHRGFRADIQGLRAVAVLTVVLWHAHPALVPGGFVGVDVFFVISGFLMTGVLLTQIERDGRVDLGTFYARRARRLLPAAVAALLGAVAVTVAVVPSTQWVAIGKDVVASALYVVNWRMAASSVDYLAHEGLPSPVQHYWSLSVEEQYYLVWPVLLGLLALLAKRLGGSLRRWALVGLVAAGGLSLAASVVLTASEPAQAYFVTWTRVWELALGGLVAVGVRRWPRMPRVLALGLGWAGLAVVLLSAALITAETPFPGVAALAPTLGTAAVLVAGPAAGARGPVLLLSPRPVQLVGDISYSLYLWHWPFVVAVMAVTGQGTPPVWLGLAAVTASAVPAWLSYRYVEEPFRVAGQHLPAPERRRSALWAGAQLSLAGAVLGVVLALAVWPPSVPDEVGARTVPAAVLAARGPSGAQLLGEDPATSPAGRPVDDPGPVQPAVDQVATDVHTALPRDPCSADLVGSALVPCPLGDPQGEKTVLVVGDSHAAQWAAAYDVAGRERGWRVVVLSKSSCPPVLGYTLPNAGAGGYTSCATFNENTQAEVARVEPDLVLLSWARYTNEVDQARFLAGVERAADGFAEHAGAVAVIRDTPRPGRNMADCLVQHPGRFTECAFPRSEGLARIGTGMTELLAARPRLGSIDLTDRICPQATCAPVIGGVVVYRDSNHLTDSYVRTLTPYLEAAMARLLEAEPAG